MRQKHFLAGTFCHFPRILLCPATSCTRSLLSFNCIGTFAIASNWHSKNVQANSESKMLAFIQRAALIVCLSAPPFLTRFRHSRPLSRDCLAPRTIRCAGRCTNGLGHRSYCLSRALENSRLLAYWKLNRRFGVFFSSASMSNSRTNQSIVCVLYRLNKIQYTGAIALGHRT